MAVKALHISGSLAALTENAPEAFAREIEILLADIRPGLNTGPHGGAVSREREARRALQGRTGVTGFWAGGWF